MPVYQRTREGYQRTAANTEAYRGYEGTGTPQNLVIHNYTQLDGRRVAESVHRHALRRKSTR